MRLATMKVGELSKRTGISVRTLHHYDKIGLLCPSQRTEAGHRLYADGEIIRLQQIVSLRQLGFSLEEIRDCLAGSDYSLHRVVELHVGRLREQIAAQLKLCERLEALDRYIRSAGDVSAEEFLQTIQEMIRVEKYYTPEQLEELRQRREVFGEERIRQAEAEWPKLIEQLRAEMDRGADPASEPVQRLAKRWMELVNEFTGGNPGIAKSLSKMWQQEDTIHGMDTREMREMMGYVSKALAASKDGG